MYLQVSSKQDKDMGNSHPTEQDMSLPRSAMGLTQVSADTGAGPVSASKHNATSRRLSSLFCSPHTPLVTAGPSFLPYPCLVQTPFIKHCYVSVATVGSLKTGMSKAIRDQ